MPPATLHTERLLHCSPERTVLARQEPGTGEPVVVKVFVAGGLAAAEREFAMARLAAGPGVVAHLRTGLDAASNRPCLVTAHAAGPTLEHLVAEQGALPAAIACELLAPVADTLARLHGLRLPAAPAGLCHGDVKPGNLVRTADQVLLLDFEHAHPIAPAGSPPVALGTAGFRAPEAAHGGVPSAALDVFGLGAVLAWLLAGGLADDLPRDPRLDRLLADCTSPDPARRPPAAAVATRLRELAEALRDDPAEADLADWATAAFRAPSGSRTWQRRAHLLRRCPQLLARPADLPADPAALRTELARVGRVLRRFPRHAQTLRWRQDLLRHGARLLADAAPHAAALGRSEAFAAAAAWLGQLESLVREVRALPGGLPCPADEEPAAARPRLVDPLAFVQRLAAQTALAQAELQEETERITEAEQRLDVRGAEAAVEQMAARHGGASPTVARQRDRVHRLAFYLDRVARAEANLERVAPLWDAAALQPLFAFADAAVLARGRSPRSDASAGAVGLRSLQLTLTSLAEEFPHLPAVPPALEALTLLLAHVTDTAWQLLAEARSSLAAVPVPVRPLQLALGRLDTFRILEAFVDRPERPRSQLLDGIEALRLQLEQARATRDRLAESAEHALARGHWTTGLFDMERAVAGMSPADEREAEEATRLQERLEQARRRKQEVEAAVRRNVDLATRYGTLQDDSASTFGHRLQVLEERRDCLLFLTMHVPAERSVLYQRDLRDVDTQIALERAGLAEHQLDGTVAPEDRLRLARATLDQLAASVAQGERGQDPPGRVVRLLEHWRTVAAHCQRAVDQLHAERAARARARTRLVALAVAAFLVTTTAVVFAVRPWLRGEPASAAEKPAPQQPGR